MENNIANEQRAAEYEAKAAACIQEREDSFDRCDTDGFLSQWASGLTASMYQMQAEIERNGGMAEFPALFDLNGNRVPAKMIEVNNPYSHGTRAVWALVNPLNPSGKFMGFVTPLSKDVVDNPDGGYTLKPNKRSENRLRKQGYVQGVEMAPAKAKIVGYGRGLSGNAWAAVVRTDGGYPGAR